MLYKHLISDTVLKILHLYSGDYGKALYTREVARSIGIDIKAVQIQLKRLESNGILSSLPRGKNLEYNINLNNINSKYYLMLAEQFNTLLLLNKKQAIKKILEKMDGSTGALVLFGSFASGKEKDDSDVDILAITSEKDIRAKLLNAAGSIGREINLLQMDPEAFKEGIMRRDPLVVEILSNHVVLKGVESFCEAIWDYHAKRH
jgi:predicted nucleotidyltransferase